MPISLQDPAVLKTFHASALKDAPDDRNQPCAAIATAGSSGDAPRKGPLQVSDEFGFYRSGVARAILKILSRIPKEDASDRIARVIYTSKNGQRQKTFDALEWLAQLVVHLPRR